MVVLQSLKDDEVARLHHNEYHSNAKEARNTLRHGDQRRTSAAALAASASPMVTVTFAGETSQAKLGRVLAVGSHTRREAVDFVVFCFVMMRSVSLKITSLKKLHGART